jgi:hypothetical protein
LYFSKWKRLSLRKFCSSAPYSSTEFPYRDPHILFALKSPANMMTHVTIFHSKTQFIACHNLSSTFHLSKRLPWFKSTFYSSVTPSILP